MAALLGGAAYDAAKTGEAKRKRRKKRCKRVTNTCAKGGKRKCCDSLRCGEVMGIPGFFCCRSPHAPCTEDAECCGNRSCDTVFGHTGTFCCGSAITTPCEIDKDCCAGFACFEGFCKAT